MITNQELLYNRGISRSARVKLVRHKDRRLDIWQYAVKYFQFSILMLLPKTVTPDEAIRKEQLFKRKLGSNTFGLNNN